MKSQFWVYSVVLSFGVCLATSSYAEDAPTLGRLGDDVLNATETVQIDGHFRFRGELLHNLDLDHGLTPSQKPLFPVPLADPASQNLTHADMRLRTDIAIYSPLGDVAVKARLDFLDNVAFGSMPDGPPQTVTSQTAGAYVAVRQVWAEALTPFGLLSVGRTGSHWGLGMLTHGGDCLECDGGDSADRIAFITPVFGHIVAAAYDVGFSGPSVLRASRRSLDLDPSDDVRSWTVALMRYNTPWAVERRRDAGKTTLNYGAFVSSRSQENDVPAWYVPSSVVSGIDASQVIRRDLKAVGSDVWVRADFPYGRIELEAAYLWGNIGQGSLIPGVVFPETLTSSQWGAALETEFGKKDWFARFGLNAGVASGDGAPGFGATPGAYDPAPLPGDLDGPQANLPSDVAVNNFRFHPNYRVDRILFREIVGTVTDAFYVRPHVHFVFGQVGAGNFKFELAGIYSQALNEASTPGNAAPLGVEINPTLSWEGRAFSASLEHALLMPFSGLDNINTGLSATSAQLLRVNLWMAF